MPTVQGPGGLPVWGQLLLCFAYDNVLSFYHEVEEEAKALLTQHHVELHLPVSIDNGLHRLQDRVCILV
jgi:hypothetical protein